MPRHTDWQSISFAAAFGAIATLTVLVLLFPTAVILILSFTGEESLHFPPASYSLRWYRPCSTPTRSRTPPSSA